MNRMEAVKLLEEHLPNKNLIKHSIAVEAGMRKMAQFLGEKEEERWAMSGLLHDLDYEKTKDDFPKHGFLTGEILRRHGFDDTEILDAIVMHSGNVPATTDMGKALYAVDPTTGFITACVLMSPTKNIHFLDMGFMMKRFKEKRFAAGANRDQIASATVNFPLSLEDFITIVLEGMKENSEELGLGKL
ncbi:HD domain-containing protein [bacterium]|nr:HD domain-containing protein [bacterium]